MTQSTVKTPDPQCPVCQGKGWFFVPTFHVDFGAQSEFHPCPDCNPTEPLGRSGCLMVVAFFAVVVALLAWGAR